MNSVLLDSSFLISLSDDSRSDHDVAERYFYTFIERGVIMHLSTIVVCEYEVKQRVTDLGMHNFIVMPFNIDEAIAGAAAFTAMHPLRAQGDDRAAVSADAKLMGQCINAGIQFFITGDDKCRKRIERICQSGSQLPFPQPICTCDPFDASWFNNGQYQLIDPDE